MLLHQFMDEHRQEIFVACTHYLNESVPAHELFEDDLKLFFEEVYQALRREAGNRDSSSPLPGRSEAAARLGSEPQRTGMDPAKVPFIFGAISNALGEVGARYGLEIGAADYKVFNQCMDAGVATSIQHFWDGERRGERAKVSATLGELAHELRQALGNACLAFKLLRSGEVSVNGKTAGVLGTNLARMELLTARTLGEVQLNAGVAPSLRPLLVATVLRKLHSSFISDRGVALVLKVDDSLLVMADEMLLVSAVSNLLSNASKFSCSGGRVELRCFARDQAVVIEVEDECGGLNTDDPSKLLLPFVKGREHPSNVGLGLSIVKRGVEAMGGAVQISNHPGKGCTFALVFPRAEGDALGVVAGEA
jgi:anti-sigma regulatory factor (Ser/Thr protein kinase)